MNKQATGDEHYVSSMDPMTVMPMGIVRSRIKEPILRADKDGLSLKERMQKVREHHQMLKTLVSELIVDEKLSGFATCSPAWPNPILICGTCPTHFSLLE